MSKLSRASAILSAGIALALVAGCADTVPLTTTTSYYPSATVPVAGLELGRVTNIEYLPAGTVTSNNSGVIGALVGGIAGAALGNSIGSGGGRTATTILGGAAGAMIGSQIARNAHGATTAPGYRITMMSDSGITRTYEVPSTGDLRIGDRVRVDNGVIYRA